MRKTPIRRKSKSKTKKFQDKLWELCKQIVRKRDGSVCVICGKCNLTGSGWHTGHLIPSASCGAFLRYDLRNIHSSCYNCNINLGGNGCLFAIKMEQKYGREWLDRLIADKQVIIKADEIFYEQKIQTYKEMETWGKGKLLKYTKNL